MDIQNFFSTILNMSITGAIVIVCVMLARLALRGVPRVFSYALWAVVLFRLLCPVSVSSPVSVLNLVEAPVTEQNVDVVEYVTAPVRDPVETVVPLETVVSNEVIEAEVPSVAEPIDWHLIAARIWAVGVIAMAVYGIASYVNLKRKLREAACLEKGVREADSIRSPFVLGLVHPVIYLPSDLPESEREYILLHEKFHVRHLDHVVRAVFFAALCLHWFNPLVWLAFTLAGRDMEMRCDEAVLKKLGPQVRCDYAQSLLNLATGRRWTLCAPLAFGEGDTGKRVKHVLKWKRRAVWVLIPAAVVCAVVLVITAVNPGGGSLFGESPFGHSYKATTVVPTRYEEPVEQEQLFTLTSDMALFIRDTQDTSMRGSFKKLNRLPDSCDAYSDPVEWALLKSQTENAWEAVQSGPDNYLLLQLEDGTLYLIQGETTYYLERTDLLGISVNQPGSESHIEPTWYRADSPDWYSGSLSGTNVDGDAEVYFIPETEVDTITVSEEYYQRLGEGQTEIIKTTYTVGKNAGGDYVLEVSRRGDEADDYAIYHVEVGEDNYMFRLNFPAVPGVTSFTGVSEEETKIVEFRDGGAYITLELPESWEYEITSLAGDAYSAGITFWPLGREEGKLRFEYYPSGFGVCGTGLESRTMTLGGREVSAGTYDGDVMWDFIGLGEKFAVWGENQHSWWAEYGERAMEVLDTAQFGEYVDMNAVRSYFQDYRLHDDLGPGEVLRGEKDYQAVYYPQREELRLYEYTAAGTKVSVLNEWAGRVYEDVCISVNCLEREGEYVYFGYLRSSQDGADLTGGAFHFLLEDGWTIDMILDEFKGFCFVCDEPMADFEIRTADGELAMDLQSYLDKGCEIAEAEGKILLNVEGEPICMLPLSPTEP